MRETRRKAGAQAKPGRITMAQAQASDTGRNKDLVQQYVHAVWVEGDLEKARQFVSPDYVYRQGGTGPLEFDRVCGLDGLHKVIEFYQAHLPTRDVRSERFVTQGDMVVWLFECTGKFQGEVMGIAPTNSTVTWSVVGIYRIEDGKIAEERYVDDFVRAVRRAEAGR